MATGSHMRHQQRRQHLQRRGQNVGQHGLVAAFGRVHQIRQAGVQRHMVAVGVDARRFHCGRVDVHRIDLRGTEFGRTDRQNARAAAIVQHRAQLACIARLAVARNPAQAHARGGMGAGAKGQTRIQTDHLLRLRRRLVPARHDPELLRDVHRRELRLRQAHPVLLGHVLHAHDGGSAKEVLQLQQARRLTCRLLLRKQGDQQ